MEALLVDDIELVLDDIDTVLAVPVVVGVLEVRRARNPAVVLEITEREVECLHHVTAKPV